MKTFFLLAVTSIISTGAFASGMSIDTKKLYTATTFAPTVFAGDCAKGLLEACAISSTSGTTYLASTLLLLKEEVQQVEPDAYAFLAGEDMSLALEEAINNIREQAPELNDHSDAEILTLALSK